MFRINANLSMVKKLCSWPPSLLNKASKSISTVQLSHAEYLPKSGWEKDRVPLVILHGLCGSKNNWHIISKKLAQRLNRPVLAVDARNHGDSDHAPSMQYREMAQDVVAHLDELCIPRAHILGHSMGGRTVMALALLQPELVKSLIVEDSTPNWPSGVGSIIRNYLEVMKAVDMSLLDGSVASLRKRAIDQLESVEKNMGIRAFLVQNIVADKDNPSSAVWRLNLDAIYDSLDDIVSWDSSLAGLQYTGPSCFIGGAKSVHQPTGEFSQEQKDNVALYFTSPQYHIIQDAGHWVHSEQPQRFMDCVQDFLNGL